MSQLVLKDKLLAEAKSLVSTGGTIEIEPYGFKHWRQFDAAKPEVEALGVSIEWDGDRRLYILTAPEPTPTPDPEPAPAPAPEPTPEPAPEEEEVSAKPWKVWKTDK